MKRMIAISDADENSSVFWDRYWDYRWDQKLWSIDKKDRYVLTMFSKRANDFSIEFLSKYWTKIWKVWKIDLKFEFEMLSISSSMLKKSSWFVWRADVISEVFQKTRIFQILIWNCRYWKFCKRIDWFFNSSIDAITETKKKNWNKCWQIDFSIDSRAKKIVSMLTKCRIEIWKFFDLISQSLSYSFLIEILKQSNS